MRSRWRRVGLSLVCGLLTSVAPALAADSSDARLAEKARLHRADLVARHRAPEGVVLYRMSLPTVEADLRDGTYPGLADTPTFTGLLAVASCLRANHPAERAQALDDAGRALAGLEHLMAVTGVRGLLARGIRRDGGGDTSALSGEWQQALAPYERWVFRSDASQDQYANGLLPAIHACARWFPERARRLVVDVAEHLWTHDMRLVDVDGEPTRYGDLSARSSWGVNSIAQLTGYAAFALAARLDDDPRWGARRDALRDRHRVVARSRRTNLRILGITNHSNDLMAFHLLEVLLDLARESGDPARADLRHALYKARLRVRPYQNAYLDLVWCRLETGRCPPGLRARIRRDLEGFPSDKRGRPADPRLRDLPRRWIPGRKGRTLARDLVPIALRPRSSFEWKSSPYRVTGGGLPVTEYTGLDYLVAYWRWRSLPSRED